MTSSDRPRFGEPSPGRPISRAAFLRGAALAAAGGVAFPLLSACGSSGGAGSTGSGGSTAASTGSATGATLSAAEIATIKKFLGPVDAKYAGAGQTWHIGGIFPFSTSGSVYGEVMGNGAKLAAEHIKQLGGPNIEIDFRDSAGSDVVKVRNAFVAFAGLPAVLSSYEAAGTIAKDLIAKNHNFSIDPGGGNAPPGEGVPYYWGMRANWGMDGFKLQGTYFAQKLKKPKLVVVFYNVGAASTEYTDAAKALLAEGGAEVVNVVLAQAGATDYSNELSAIRATGDFDAVSLGIDGNDIAYFLKQYQTSGIGKPIVTWEAMLAPTAKIAGLGAYENVYLGGIDAFSTTSTNPWAQLMVRSYQAAFGTSGVPAATPDYESAGYYDAVFLLWRLYRDVKAKGGDVNDGAQLQAALQANPTAVGIKGGTATAAGTYQFDLATHGLKHIPMGLYQVRDGAPVLVASSDIGGSGIKILDLPPGASAALSPVRGQGRSRAQPTRDAGYKMPPAGLEVSRVIPDAAPSSEDVPVVLAGPQLPGGFLARDPPGAHHVDPVHDPQQLRHVLLEDEDRDPPVLDQLAQRVEDPDGHRGRETERRLVEQHELRVGHQRHADAEHALLPAGELAGPPLRVLLEHREDLADGFKQRRTFRGGRPQRAQLQVLGDAEVGEDELLGRDQGHAREHVLVAGPPGDALPPVHHLPAAGPQHAEDGVQGGGLACSVVAYDADDLTRPDGQADVEDHLLSPVPGLQAGDLEKVAGPSRGPLSGAGVRRSGHGLVRLCQSTPP
jgi:ABC-type branched-subunit amino acid transport system substrate-binding protein